MTTNAFDQMHPRDQEDFLKGISGFVDGADERERAAHDRHVELVGYLNLFAAAAAAGARAFADALDRRPRR